MKENTYQKFAGVAAFIVALSSLTYGLIFLFLVPPAQKQLAKTAASLISYAANPTGRQIASLLLALGGLAATAAVVAIYRRLREANPGWAMWSLVLGLTYGMLTAIYGIYIAFLFPILSSLYVNGNAATQASVLVVGSIPSPLDPFGFTKFVLSGSWLLITGVLMLRSLYFPRALAYLPGSRCWRDLAFHRQCYQLFGFDPGYRCAWFSNHRSAFLVMGGLHSVDQTIAV